MDYLAGFYSDGQFDSQGCFELSFRDSRVRYATLIEGEKEAFLRLLLQSILASGAGRIEVALRKMRCQMNWTATQPWGESELQHLFDYFRGEKDAFDSTALQLAKLGGVLTSCRPDLRLTLMLPDLTRALVLDSDGPRFTANTETVTASCIRLDRIGEKPAINRPSLWDITLSSPILSRAWPELFVLKEQLSNLTAVLDVNKSRWNVDALDVHPGDIVLGETTLRRAYVHQDPSQNNLTVASARTHLRQKPVHPICQGLDGQTIRQPPGEPARAYFGVSIHRAPIEDTENRIKLHEFRILRYGVPLFISQDLVPSTMRVVIDGSWLPTDLTSRNPVQSEALQSKIREALNLMQRAVQDTLGELQNSFEATQPVKTLLFIAFGGMKPWIEAVQRTERELQKIARKFGAEPDNFSVSRAP